MGRKTIPDFVQMAKDGDKVTWITGYDTPYWAPTVTYGKKQMKSQAKALKDAGLEGGFIPWNAASDIGKYRQYKAVWNE